jgi:resuscitation-promoting factor RpfB
VVHRSDQRSRRYARAVKPSPARARPHDARAWLPLPDLDALPPLDDLIEERAAPAAPAGRGADVRPVPARPAAPFVRPSPARAEPHDPGSWFPLLAMEQLLAPDRLVDSGQTRAVTDTAAAPVAEPEADRNPDPVLEPPPAPARPARPARPTRPARPSRPERPRAAPRPARQPRQPRGAAARRTDRTVRRRRTLVIALAAAATVTAGAAAAAPRLVGGADPPPEVTLRVDGKRLVVDTEAETVRGVLRAEQIEVGPSDRVEPALTTPVTDGLAVAIHRAFPVTVDFDGDILEMTTTRRSVAALQRELKLDPDTVAVKFAPDRLGADATVTFRTRRNVTVNFDGVTQSEVTLGLTVQEVLGDYAIKLGPMDQVNPPVETPVAEGMVVTVVRISTDLTTVVQEPEPFTEERREDPSLLKGKEVVAQEGVAGVADVTMRLTTADGVEIGREAISRVVVTPPVNRIVMVGTALPNQRVGTASWYASPFGSDSCATKEYVPKGTILKITNLDTGASTTCRVADRVEANRVVDADDDVFRQLAPLGQGVFNARIDWA